MRINDFCDPKLAFPFGIDPARTAAFLRSMADSIEAKEVVVQSARIMALASVEDYAVTGLRIVFAQKNPPVETQPEAAQGA